MTGIKHPGQEYVCIPVRMEGHYDERGTPSDAHAAKFVYDPDTGELRPKTRETYRVHPDFLESIERDSNGTFDINKVSIWKVQAKFVEGGDCTGNRR